MNIIWNSIQWFDVLGVEPKLLFKKKHQFTTVFGGCTSLFFLFLCTFSFVFFLLKLIIAETTSLSFSSNYVDLSSIFETDEGHIKIMFLLSPSLNTAYNNKEVSIKFSNGIADIPLSSCPANYFYTSSGSMTELCPTSSTGLSLKSTISSGGYELKITKAKADSTTYEMEAVFQNKMIFPSDYNNPTEESVYREKIRLTSNQSKYVEVNYKTVAIQTDSAWIFEDNSTINYFVVGSTEQKKGESGVLTMNIKVTPLRETIIRRYYKLQDFAAQLGGFLKFLHTLGSIFVYPVNEAYYYHSLIESEKVKRKVRAASNIVMGDQPDNDQTQIVRSNTIMLMNKLKKVSLFRVILSNFCILKIFNNEEANEYRQLRELIEEKLDIQNFLLMLRKMNAREISNKKENNFV